MSVLNYTGSAPELRAQLRKKDIDIKILEKKLKAAQACLKGDHKFSMNNMCFVCGQEKSS